MSDALRLIRERMISLGIDALIVGSGDSHQSEYVSAYDKRREFLTGFTGSAGTALVMLEKALLWTDGRYFTQASTELSYDWTLMRSGDPGVMELDAWIARNLSAGSVVGVDPMLISTKQARDLKRLLSENQITLLPLNSNPVDEIWDSLGSRPAAPCHPIRVHSLSLAGVSYQEKIAEGQRFLTEIAHADAVIISALDEICWLFNIRGSDVECNPVVISYAAITKTKSYLFVDGNKLCSEDALSHFDPNVVEIVPYDSIKSFVSKLASDNKKVCIDPLQLNWGISLLLTDCIVEKNLWIAMAKSLKNSHEIDGIRQAHLRDGVALTAFLAWLEHAVRQSPGSITEYDVAVKIEEFRGKMPGHVGPSFDTIAGYGPNGAIIHYKPSRDTAATLGTDALFLLDSGAQYVDGTTDVTRTIAFGDVSQRMKDCYTLVLKGHIALARVVFPEGTVGSRLDAMARAPLWSFGLDYNHGTGHGVGAYLNVHEGPQGISFRKRDNEAGFVPGMTTSNEPGYYEVGAFGVRIENVCITVESNTPNKFMNKRYCEFENATMVAIKTSLVNVDLMTSDEVDWLNAYNGKVRESLKAMMMEYFPEAVDYLVAETLPLKK